jgi:tRNA1(Val) A37 N6-methylase TrmN6
MEMFRAVGHANAAIMKGKESRASLHGKWSRKFAQCNACGQTSSPHAGKGVCILCTNSAFQLQKTKEKNQCLLAGVENIDYVICQLCRQPFERLTTNGHLKTHSISVPQYLNKFPSAKTIAEKISDNLGLAVSLGRKRLFKTRGYLNPASQRLKKSIEMSLRHATDDFAKVSAPEKVVADWFMNRGYDVVLGEGEACAIDPKKLFWQYNLLGKFCVDFADPSREIAIEVLGGWWHGYDFLCGKEKYEDLHPKVKRNLHLDKIRFTEIEKAGWTLLKLWDKDIKDKSFVIELSKYYPSLGRQSSISADELLLAAKKEKSTTDNIPLSKLVHSHTQRMNARWLENQGIIKTKNSLLTFEEASKLLALLRPLGDKSIIPDDVIEEEFAAAREKGFPYNDSSFDMRLKDWSGLIKAKIEKSDGMYNWAGRESRLATSFHPHFYECRRKGKMSPVEFFMSDDDLKRGIRKAICLHGKITPATLRDICRNEDASSSVNNFPPRVIMALLQELCPDKKGIRLLDPCAGFSGRIIGAAASGRVSEYHGIDFSRETAEGLNNTACFLAKVGSPLKTSISYGDCISIMPMLPNDYDLVFTSPPFLDVEEYKNVVVEHNYAKWLREFIVPFIAIVFERLKSGGRLAIYSENINSRKAFSDDFMELAEQAGFKTESPVVFKKSRGTYQRSKEKFKPTPIYVWIKS